LSEDFYKRIKLNNEDNVRKCQNCDNTFNFSKNKKKKFCSSECMYKSISSNRIGIKTSKNYILRTSKNSLNRDIKYFRDRHAPIHNMFKNIFMLIKKNKAKCRKTSITTILKHFYLIEKIIKK
jgi:hypothetical protein